MKRTWLSTLLLLLLGTGCETSIPETETSTGALNGNIIFDDSSCNGVASRISSAMSAAASTISALSPIDPSTTTLTECMRQAVLSWDEDAWPEDVVAFVTQNMPTHFRCANPLANGRNSDAPLGPSPGSTATETMTLNTAFVQNNEPRIVMGEILFAVAQNKGYSTSSPFSTSMGTVFAGYELPMTAPEQIRECALSIAFGENPPRPFNARLDDHFMETVLPTNGRVGGSKFEQKCPNGQIAVGVLAGTSNRVDSVGLTCRAPAGGSTTDTGLSGGTGGTFRRLVCGGTNVLVGVAGRAGAWNDAIAPICAVNADRTNGYVIEVPSGGAGGLPYQRLCPRGLAVRALKGRTSDRLNRLQVECQRASLLEPVNDEFIGTAGSLSQILSERCGGRSVLTTLIGQTGQFVDRMGGICSTVRSACGTNGICQDALSGVATFMIGHGGHGGALAEDFCPNGQALVGLRTRSGSVVDAMGGICTRTDVWSTVGTPTLTNLTMRGGAGGAAQTLMCNRGSFLVGWDYSVGSFLNGISPVCRNFTVQTPPIAGNP